MKTIICSICKQEKEVRYFPNCKTCKGLKSKQCYKCLYKKRNSYRRKEDRENSVKNYHLKRVKNPLKYREYLKDKKEYRLLNKARYMLRAAKSRAKRKNYNFNIDISDIVIPEFCPLLGIKLELVESHTNFYSPSLDKIDNDKGYVKGNVRVISRKANMMKWAASKEELLNFAKNIPKYLENV